MKIEESEKLTKITKIKILDLKKKLNNSPDPTDHRRLKTIIPGILTVYIYKNNEKSRIRMIIEMQQTKAADGILT